MSVRIASEVIAMCDEETFGMYCGQRTASEVLLEQEEAKAWLWKIHRSIKPGRKYRLVLFEIEEDPAA